MSFSRKTHQNTTAYKIFQELLPSKMAKLQGLSKIHLLWRYNDVIEALNLKTNAIFEKGTSKYPMLPTFVLLP